MTRVDNVQRQPRPGAQSDATISKPQSNSLTNQNLSNDKSTALLTTQPNATRYLDIAAKTAVIFIGSVTLVAIIHLAKNVVMPITAAFICAMIIGPIGDRSARFGISSIAANLAIVIILITVLVLLIVFVSPQVVQSLSSMPEKFEGLSGRIKDFLDYVNSLNLKFKGSDSYGEKPGANFDISKLLSDMTLYLAAALSPALSNLLIFIVSLLMLVVDRALIKNGVVRMFSNRSQRLDALKTLNRIEKSLSGYLLVVTSVNATIALLLIVAYSILGIPGAIFIGASAFVLNFFPFVGPLFLKLALLAFGFFTYDFTLKMLMPVAVYSVIVIVESNLVTPVLVGRKFTMRPILVFGSIVLWTWLWGVAGALLAMPILVISAIVYDTLTPDRKVNLP